MNYKDNMMIKYKKMINKFNNIIHNKQIYKINMMTNKDNKILNTMINKITNFKLKINHIV